MPRRAPPWLSSSRRADVLVRSAVGLSLLTLLFVLRWRFDGALYDFQVFRAADAIARDGGDPYRSTVLNAELAGDPGRYGKLWADDSTGNFEMFFFNPPSWLTQIRAFGGSAFALSIVSGVVMTLAAVRLGMERSAQHALGHATGAFLFLALGSGDSTMWYGQTGLAVAALVGMYLVLVTRAGEGTPIALFSFKPHLALALGLPSLVANPMRTAIRVALPLLFLVVVTLALYDPQLWWWWIRGLMSGERTVVYNDLTARTLSPRYPLPDWSTWPLLVGSFAAIAAMAMRFRRADPMLLACTALGVTAFASGHAFSHDFLWLVFVPIVCRWRPLVTIAAATLFNVGYWSGRSRILWNLLEVNSLVALAAVITLVLATRNSHLDRSESVVDVCGGESTIDGEDGAGSQQRLSTR